MSNRVEEQLSHSTAVKRTAVGVATVFGRHAVVRGLAFLSTLILARLISPSSFGVFVAAQFILSLMQSIAVGGITSALVRRKEIIENREYNTAFTIQQMQSALVAIAVYFLSPFIVDIYELPTGDVWIFRAMAIGLFPISVRAIALAKLQRVIRNDLIALSEIAEYLVYMVVAIGLAAAGWDVWALVMGTLLRCFVGAAVMQILSGDFPRFGLQPNSVKHLVASALPLQVQLLVDLAQRSIVPVAVGTLLGVSAIGVLGMANTILDALILQPLVLVASMQLRLLARVQDDIVRFGRLIQDFYCAGAVVFLPLLIVISLSGPRLMPTLLSSEWSDVGSIIFWLTLSSALQIISIPTAQAAKALGELKAPLVAGLVNLGIQLAILLASSNALGLYAYPAATTVGAIVSTIYLTGRVFRIVGRGARSAIIPIVSVNFVFGSVYWVLLNFVGSVSILLIFSAVIVFMYIAAIFLFSGDFVARMLRFASKAMPKRLAHWLSNVADWLELRGHGNPKP